MSVPTAAEIDAYRRGALSPTLFDAVDAYLAALPADEQVRLLDAAPSAAHEAARLSETLGELGPGVGFSSTSDAAHGGARVRYRIDAPLGAGGMGVVELAYDLALDRPVAIKRLRPRAPDEALEGYALRLRAFRREAAITAQLEHPAIVPVHDVGCGPMGEPAYVMKRLEGVALDAWLRARGGRVPAAAAVAMALRIGEAIAHAHARGLVHRDLKPANVIVGAHGDIAVIDWGLAARVQTDGVPAADRSSSAGTPAWMAPEQAHGASVDPRQDVFALGGLLMLLLTGRAPRGLDGANIDLSPLNERFLPRGLVAVARRCLATNPAARYVDGAAVVADLERWLAAGLTLAERPHVLKRAWVRVRASRFAAAALLLVLGAFATVTWGWVRARTAAQDTVARLTTTALDDDAAVMAALRELAAQGAVATQGAVAALPQFGQSAGVRALTLRLQTAHEVLTARVAQERVRAQLLALSARFRRSGPWPEESAHIVEVLRTLGFLLHATPAELAADGAQLRTLPLRADVLPVLAQLQRALLTSGRNDIGPTLDAAGLRAWAPAVLETADDAWAAVGALLSRAQLAAHDLRLCVCPASETALAEPLTADVLLATYGPEPRLVAYADARIAADPGAFWARVVAARAAYASGDLERARRHALVALGQEPRGLWPHLLLAYIALRESDSAELRDHAEAAHAVNPAHLEARLLLALAHARTGDPAMLQTLVNEPAIAGHLRYHLEHPLGHPMEDAARAVIAIGVELPSAPSELSPLLSTPGHQHH